jgi:hypothetical protein
MVLDLTKYGGKLVNSPPKQLAVPTAPKGSLDLTKFGGKVVGQTPTQSTKSGVSALHVLGQEAAYSAAPTIGGLAAGVGAATLAAPLVAIPFAGVPLVIGAGLIGAIGGSMLVEKVQKTILNTVFGKDKETQMEQERVTEAKQHPVAAFAGDVAPQLLVMKPSPKNVISAAKYAKALFTTADRNVLKSLITSPVGKQQLNNLVNVTVGGGVQGGQELVNQIKSGDYNAVKLASQTILGTILNEPNKFGVKLGMHPTGDITVNEAKPNVKPTIEVKPEVKVETKPTQYVQDTSIKPRTGPMFDEAKPVESPLAQEATKNTIKLYHGTESSVGKSIDKNGLRFGDFLTADKNEALDYAKMRAKQKGTTPIVKEFNFNKNEVSLNVGTNEWQYKGGTNLQGGKYPEKIYKAVNEVWGQNATKQEIDKLDFEMVRDTASQGLSGGKTEFDKLYNQAVKTAPEVPYTKPRLPAIKPTVISNETKLFDLKNEIEMTKEILDQSPYKILTKYESKQYPGTLSEKAQIMGDKWMDEAGLKNTDMSINDMIDGYEKYAKARNDLRKLETELKTTKGDSFKDYSEEDLARINELSQLSSNSNNEVIRTRPEAPKGLATPLEPKMGDKASRVFERMQAEHPELEGKLGYTEINLKEDSARAVELSNSDPQEAYRVAMGKESKDVTSTAVNIALSEKALEEGNYELATQLIKNRSLAQTRRGQEIVSEKGSVTSNDTAKFVKELISDKMNKLGNKLKNPVDTLMKKSSIKKASEYIDVEVKKAQRTIKDTKKLDIREAQNLLDKLACK